MKKQTHKRGPLSDQGNFRVNFLLLFFGTWLADFLMCDQGIHSPFHWFYGSLQAVIYYVCLSAYYAALTAMALGAVALVIWFASKLYEIYLWIRTPVADKPAKENSYLTYQPQFSNLADIRPTVPASPVKQADIIPIVDEMPEPAPKPPPPKPRKSEEEIMRETLLALKRRY